MCTLCFRFHLIDFMVPEGGGLYSPVVAGFDPESGGFLRFTLPVFGYSSVVFVLMKTKALWFSETRVYSRLWDVHVGFGFGVWM